MEVALRKEKKPSLNSLFYDDETKKSVQVTLFSYRQTTDLLHPHIYLLYAKAYSGFFFFFLISFIPDSQGYFCVTA